MNTVEIHPNEPSTAVLKEMFKNMMTSNSTDEDMKKIKALDAQITRHNIADLEKEKEEQKVRELAEQDDMHRKLMRVQRLVGRNAVFMKNRLRHFNDNIPENMKADVELFENGKMPVENVPAFISKIIVAKLKVSGYYQKIITAFLAEDII